MSNSLRHSVRACLLFLVGVCFVASTVAAQTGVDPDHGFAWSENTGWINAAPTNSGSMMTVVFNGTAGWLRGHVWSENVGWIKLGSDTEGPYANSTATDWGVNMDSFGNFSGFAWGENVGWISFDHTHDSVSVSLTTGVFSGYAWGENIGWLHFYGESLTSGLRTMAFDLAELGTPNWWLNYHAVNETFDVGDGVPAWKKYVMDTDPHGLGDVLQITSVSNLVDSLVAIAFGPTSPRRSYSLLQQQQLGSGNWSNAANYSTVSVEGTGLSFRVESPEVQTFYRIRVDVAP